MPTTHHRIDQGLVSISQVCGEPSGWFLEGLGRPLPIWNMQRSEATVFSGGVLKPVWVCRSARAGLRCEVTDLHRHYCGWLWL